MTDTGFLAGVRREIRRMASRKMYIFGMVAVPVLMAVFFLSLLKPGLPLKVPTAVVDLDHSSMSRTVTRSLNALELIDISRKLESYDEALAGIRRGEIYGFFVIPDNFEKDALGGRTPTLEYYTNLTRSKVSRPWRSARPAPLCVHRLSASVSTPSRWEPCFSL